MNDKKHDGYIIEFVQLGSTVKVSAADPQTLIEVSVVGASSASHEDLTRLALRKLHYVINKQKT